MKTIYNIFKKYGRQTDRFGYSVWRIEVCYHAHTDSYTIAY